MLTDPRVAALQHAPPTGFMPGTMVNDRFTLLRRNQDKALLIVVRPSGGPLDLVLAPGGAWRVTNADSGRGVLAATPDRREQIGDKYLRLIRQLCYAGRLRVESVDYGGRTEFTLSSPR